VQSKIISKFNSLPYTSKLNAAFQTLDGNHAIDNSAKFLRLKRATITLGISTFFTFILYIVPFAITVSKIFQNNNVFYLMLNLNAMVNIFIYFKRFKDIRLGLKSLVMCRRNLLTDAQTTVENIGNGGKNPVGIPIAVNSRPVHTTSGSIRDARIGRYHGNTNPRVPHSPVSP
jgi:hypothetical protein